MSKARIRLMTNEDLALVHNWRNHPQISQFMLNEKPIAINEHNEWYERAIQDPLRVLLIFELDVRPSGFIQILMNQSMTMASWGFYKAPSAPRGAGCELGKLGMEYAFLELGLNKLCGKVLKSNEVSIRFHKKLGFREEKGLREQWIDDNPQHPVLCFSLLRDDWKMSLGNQ